MGASNTPLYDLIELSGLSANTTYTTASGGGGDILGVVDNATYTDTSGGNSTTQIKSINSTSSRNGQLEIDGVIYDISVARTSSSADTVDVTYNGGGSSVSLDGASRNSDLAFITATPTGGGATRYFLVVDDDIGDLPDITQITTNGLNLSPSGGHIHIDADQNNNNTAFVCFAYGTMIETPEGPRAVEDIAVGDTVLTLDHGACRVDWTGARTVALDNDFRRRKNAPVRVARGALGPGVPERDLILSPQHRVLVASQIARRLFGASEVLVPVQKLAGFSGFKRLRHLPQARYCHLFTGQHDILWANGAPAESLLPEKGALEGLSLRDQATLAGFGAPRLLPARPIIETSGEVAELLRRHKKNGKPLTDPALLLPYAETRSGAAPDETSAA